ncbi:MULTISPECIES: GreA/GreB family elongation factor [Bacillaceae]|uniref:GreA/GreB family elongation factor n=1 Tax=Evansella alkalicola TaxID=745819 RepID=A0ABS6JNP5_9BACI|nr:MULTISPECIES: GreA/GreB family elongation factor [Bacillaceae]MBU9720108.1 GreA/GreB family elongation factor [Bacillus alkalicola]
MSHKIELNMQKVEDELIHQVSYFKTNMGKFVDQFSNDWSYKKRKTLIDFIEEYVAYLEAILENLSEEKLRTTVLIGSKVDVLYVDENEIDTITIVFPDQANLDENKVSFLSPFGYQLLMKESGSRISLDLPAGETTVSIEDIEFSIAHI